MLYMLIFLQVLPNSVGFISSQISTFRIELHVSSLPINFVNYLKFKLNADQRMNCWFSCKATIPVLHIGTKYLTKTLCFKIEDFLVVFVGVFSRQSCLLLTLGTNPKSCSFWYSSSILQETWQGRKLLMLSVFILAGFTVFVLIGLNHQHTLERTGIILLTANTGVKMSKQ